MALDAYWLVVTPTTVNVPFNHDIVFPGDPPNWHMLDDVGVQHVATEVGLTDFTCKPRFETLVPPRIPKFVFYDNAQGRAYNVLLQPLTTGGWLAVREAS